MPGVRSDLVSLASNFVELVMNGTNDVTGDILTHISNHRESVMNDTDVENVRTSFACILSFYSDLEKSVNVTDCLLFDATILLIIGIVSGLGIIGNVASFFIFGKNGSSEFEHTVTSSSGCHGFNFSVVCDTRVLWQSRNLLCLFVVVF